MSEPGSILRAVTFNAWAGQDDTDDPGPGDLLDNVHALIEAAGKPHVVCLQEVWGWSERVRDYARVQAPRDRFPHREARSTQLLVRRDLRLLGQGARAADGPWWTGPKHGIAHPPRVFPRASVLVEGVAWDIIGVHRTRVPWSTGGAAYVGEHRTLVDWSHDRPPDRPLVVLGDHNHPAEALQALCRDLKARAWLRGIDGALVAGASCAGLRRIPGDYGGDGHRPVHLRMVAGP